jgi:LmbE family N-acetylglucosaminyl deacetylase
MKILVIAPHPDDECIGCGGAVRLRVKRGDNVHAVFLTSGELGLKEMPCEQARQTRETEARAAAKVLGLPSPNFLRLPDWMMGDDIPAAAAKLAPVLTQIQPELIFLPHPNEWHPDHKAALPILRAASDISRVPAAKLLGYEIWTALPEYQHVEDITRVMAVKLRALRKHVSQVKQWPYVRAVRGLDEYRGAMAGHCRYAEVFQDLGSCGIVAAPHQQDARPTPAPK